MNNAEAGDVSVDHESKFRRSSLIDKLLYLSETNYTDVTNEINKGTASRSFTGWFGPHNDSNQEPKKTKNSSAIPTNDKLTPEKRQKEKQRCRPQLYVNEILPIHLKKSPPLGTVGHIDSRRTIKLGMRRLEELAAPKNTRTKIHLESYKRYEMPVKQTVSIENSPSPTPENIKEHTSVSLHAEEEELKLFKKFMKKVPIPHVDAQFSKDYRLLRELGTQPQVNFNRKQNAVSEVALHYGIGGPELSKKRKSAKDLNKNLIWNKRQQITKNGNGGMHKAKENPPKVFVKNLLNTPEKIVEQDSIKICSPKVKHKKMICTSDLPMPMPHTYILHEKTNKNIQVNNKSPKISHAIELFNWRMNPVLLPTQDTVKKSKNIYYKKTLGSVTAITENTIKAGYGGTSISKLQRKVFTGSTNKPIVPHLTGSHAEVPLLPLSPDFLRKIS